MEHPIKNFNWTSNISQLFGVNKTYYKPRYDIPGHNGIDYVVVSDMYGYGTPIVASHNGTVSKVTIENRWKTYGNGIYILNDDEKFSTVYWHLSEIQVIPGQKVKQGEIIGLMGNTGDVFPQPNYANPYWGTHLHFAKFQNGKYNEYRGFVDPTPSLFKEGEKLGIIFTRNIFTGYSGDDVSWLQTILKIEGFAEDYEPIGYFGHKTLRDCIKLQKKYEITPSLGFVGPKTRQFINSKYSKYYL